MAMHMLGSIIFCHDFGCKELLVYKAFNKYLYFSLVGMAGIEKRVHI